MTNQENTIVNPVQGQCIDSRAVSVTFFEDRAEVCREVKLSIKEGLQWVQVRGASLYTDDRSIQAKPLSGNLEVVGVRVLRHLVYVPIVGHEEKLALEKEQEALLRNKLRYETAQQRLKQQERHVQSLLEQWSQQLQANVKLDAPDALKESFMLLKGSFSRLLQEHQQLEDQLQHNDERLTVVREKLNLASQKKHSYEALIEVQLRAPEKLDEATFSLTYFTPAALWRPEHTARLLLDPGNDKKGTIELTTFATVWHRTGEDWNNLSAYFSTARPARAATPPLLQSDILYMRRKTEEEKQNLSVEIREQKIQSVAEAPTAPASEMPGVDDGGQPIVYRANEPVTLVSDGQPFRVEIVKLVIPCDVKRVAFPEKASVAYLQAKGTFSGATPLLAGPVQLAREQGFVGKNKIDFVAPGDSLTLGFGVDDAIRVRRQTKEKKEQATITGTQTHTRTVDLWLSNLSEETKEVELTERIPVSELEEVEISVIEATGTQRDTKDGFLKRTFSLAALATHRMTVVYEIKASSKVRLPA